MRIGILTFHWATNYGAVLQTYALQTYLESIGHEVKVINYKSRHFDDTLWNFIKNRKFLQFARYKNTKHKEKIISRFRDEYLNQTKRIYHYRDITDVIKGLDVIISGSDQVLTPSFLLNGEGRRVKSPAYFLDFPFDGKRIGYAVSFGCTEYPEPENQLASDLISNFDKIGVRENTGVSILEQLNYQKGYIVVPDPTILCYEKLFDNIRIKRKTVREYYCAYILHKIFKVDSENIYYIDETHNPLSMEDWLGTIVNSKGLITNSYHGMIMALLNKVPFVAITVSTGSIGMNDRFTTLLSKLGLENRICSENEDYMDVLTKEIDWVDVFDRIHIFSNLGKEFLKFQ